MPAQQRLEPGNGVRLQIELRLIDQREFVLRQRAAKIDFELAARLHVLVHRRLEEAKGALPVAFGAMQGEIRVLQDLLAVGSGGRQQDDADARRGIDQLALDQTGATDLLDQPARQRRRRLRLWLSALEDGEFVAAQPRHDIAASDHGADPVRDDAKQMVAGVTPQCFVDGLETAEVDGQHRRRFAAGFGQPLVSFSWNSRRLPSLVSVSVRALASRSLMS